jgi:hypothetical protein
VRDHAQEQWIELTQDLSGYVTLNIAIVGDARDGSKIKAMPYIAVKIRFDNPDIIAKALNELCKYRDELKKRGYEGRYMNRIDSEGIYHEGKEEDNKMLLNYFHYDYEQVIEKIEDVEKLISDFNLTDVK